VVLLGGVALVTICGVGIFYKELLLTSFDGGFARSLGWPVKVFHYGLMLLLAFAIVSALQAVGVVLVSALLVIPAAAAFLLTQRFGWMLILSAGFGILAGVGGVMVSFVGTNLPTGPYMVLAAAGIFTMAFLFAPTQGLVPRWWRMRSRTSRIARENTLKALYHALEDEEFRREIVGVGELAQRRRQTFEQARAALAEAERAGWVTSSENAVSFTPAGWQRACEIVRNHRLWELYLTHAAQMAPDHVHDDAERIEHVLGEETVWQLEKRLNYARRDPHGKLIPGRDDIRIGPRAFAVSQLGEPKP
jgi:manganese/zinc/iron transport system permease protein